jgi:subtilase family serine protease
VLCSSTTTNCGSATTPTDPSVIWQAGGGVGTSWTFSEPSYQTAVVPADLANRQDEGADRVVPDISMDADAQSGLLIGLTQTFPNGTYYDQFKEGGTSLASPLLAGVIADTDQAALAKGNTVLGFLNPTLYGEYTAYPNAFQQILPPTNPDATAVIRVNYADDVDSTDGYTVNLRAIGYAGPYSWCDETGNCKTGLYPFTAGPGYNGLTGLGSIGPDFIRDMSQF